MVTHLRISLGLELLNFSNLAIHSCPSLLGPACIVQINVSHYKANIIFFFSQRDIRISNLNASIRAQHKHEPTVRAAQLI